MFRATRWLYLIGAAALVRAVEIEEGRNVMEQREGGRLKSFEFWGVGIKFFFV